MKINMNNQQITKRLQDIKDRLNRTKETEWVVYLEGRDFSSGSSFIMVNFGAERLNDIEVLGVNDHELDFIANSKNDIKFLLDEIDRLKKLL